MRFIKDIALRGLRFGKLVAPADLTMLLLPPMGELRGADKVNLDTWSEKHGRDPRSRRAHSDGSSGETQQTSLLEWAARNASIFAGSLPARSGATKAYVLPFGKYRSFRIGQLITASRGGGRKTLLSDSTDADGVPQPGNYVKWLCSPAFAHNMTFPHHLRIYLALKEIEGAAWVSLAGETEPWTVKVCADARTLFDAYAASVMTPHAGETDPYVDVALTLP